MYSSTLVSKLYVITMNATSNILVSHTWPLSCSPHITSNSYLTALCSNTVASTPAYIPLPTSTQGLFAYHVCWFLFTYKLHNIGLCWSGFFDCIHGPVCCIVII